MAKRSSRPFWLGEDSRGWDHVRIHNTLFKDERLKANDIAVYGGIAIHAEATTGNARPSVKTLAMYTGLSERTVFRVLAHLRKCGYIDVLKRHGLASKYTLLPPPVVDTPDSVAGVQDATPDKNDTDPMTDVPITPDTLADELEPKNESSELPKTLRAKKSQNPTCHNCGKQFVVEGDVLACPDPDCGTYIKAVAS